MPDRLQRHPWDIGRWKQSASRRLLSPIARYAYRELCDESFAEGRVPDDMNQCAEICGLTPEQLSPIWGDVRARFHKAGKGWLRNHAAEEARRFVRVSIEKKKASGKLGAASRWRNNNNLHGGANADAIRDCSTSISVSSSGLDSKPTNQEKTSSRAREVSAGANGYRPDAGWAWISLSGVYPQIRDMDAACRAWNSVVEDQATEDAIRAALAPDGPWRKSDQWQRGVYDDLANWLFRKLWRGRPAPYVSESDREAARLRVSWGAS